MMTTTLILNLVTLTLYMIHLAVDVAALFLVIRWLLTWRQFAWLVPLGRAGRPVTDAMTEAVGSRLERRFGGRKLSERGRLAVCLAILALADLCLVAVAGWVT